MTDFEAIFRRYWGEVVGFALYLCGDRAEAEDVASEAFLRAWSSARPVREGTVRAYLFVIARNVFRDRLRGGRRAGALDEEVRGAAAGPEAEVEGRGELERVVAAVQRLPERDREVLVMAAAGGLPHEVIGGALGISAGAVKVRLHRARVRLGELLAESSRSAR